MEMSSSSLGGASGSGSGSVSSDSLNGLKFGKKIYFEDGGGGGVSTKAGGFSASSSSSLVPKKGKGTGQAGQPPRCQVEGCMVDLTGAKAYYCRHKVCGMHSKAPKVIVAGLEQRFCQQCSRFHQLPEFDQGKRSCRRRLAGHNERRRKPPLGSLLSHYGRFSSSFHEDNSKVGGFLMDCPYARALGRDVWPTTKVSDQPLADDCSTMSRYTPHVWHVDTEVPSVSVHGHGPHMFVQSSTSRLPFSSSEFSASESFGVSESSCALSLLSSQPWAPRNRASGLVASNYMNDEAAENSYQQTHGTTTNSVPGNTWSFRNQESSGDSHEMIHELGPRRVPWQLLNSQLTGEVDSALQAGQQRIEFQQSRAYIPSGHQMHGSL